MRPFQISTSVRVDAPTWELPTAIHEVLDTHDTADNTFAPEPRFGLGMRFHEVPFHDSMSVRFTPLGFSYRPTAVQELVDTQEMAYRKFHTPPGLGLGTIFQVVPFHDSTSVRSTPGLV